MEMFLSFIKYNVCWGRNYVSFNSLTVMEILSELNLLGSSVVKYYYPTNKILKFCFRCFFGNYLYF